ncbi:MAG: DHHA1 domain-containing protein [Chloroflexota bacterium]
MPPRPTHVLYHGNCPDGFGGAWSVRKALGDAVQYIPVEHGAPPPALPANAAVVLIDFAYRRDVMLEMRTAVASLLVLDHHKTAEADLAGLDFAIFDMDRSGARIAWDHFHPGVTPPALILHVEDRDLWRHALPRTREISAALASYPFDFRVWDGLDVDSLAAEGSAILRFKDQTVQSILNFARMGTVGGHNVPIVNASTHLSDIGAALLARYPDAPFVAAYHDDAAGRRRWSLRSREGFDVGDLARSLGGGGHARASGFSEDPPAR